MTRDRKLTIRLSSEELAMLQRVADDEGLTVSDWIRTMARRQDAKRNRNDRKGG